MLSISKPIRSSDQGEYYLSLASADDYYLDGKVTLTTNSQVNVTAQHSGPACVGAIAFFIDRLTKASRSLDRTSGVLTSFVIPQ